MRLLLACFAALAALWVQAPAWALSPSTMIVVQPAVTSASTWTGQTPTDFFGSALKMWLDVDDLSTGSVSTWTDRTSAITVTAAGSAQPTKAASSFVGPDGVGRPGLAFDGVANTVATTTLTGLPTGSTLGTIMVMVDQQAPASDTNAVRIVAYGGVTGATLRAVVRNTGGQGNVLADGGLTDQGRVLVGPHGVVSNYLSTTSIAGLFDGGDFRPPSATTNSLNTGTTRLRVAATNATSAGGFCKCVFRQVLITTALTTLQLQQGTGWLAWDGGAMALLPYNHPFRLRKP